MSPPTLTRPVSAAVLSATAAIVMGTLRAATCCCAVACCCATLTAVCMSVLGGHRILRCELSEYASANTPTKQQNIGRFEVPLVDQVSIHHPAHRLAISCSLRGVGSQGAMDGRFLSGQAGRTCISLQPVSPRSSSSSSRTGYSTAITCTFNWSRSHCSTDLFLHTSSALACAHNITCVAPVNGKHMHGTCRPNHQRLLLGDGTV